MTELSSVTDLCRRSCGDDAPAVLTRARPDIDQIVGLPHHRFVVLHHQDAVALIAQVAQGVDQTLVVAWMQPDRRFVEHIADAHQARPDARRQSHTLQFAAAERVGGPVQGQVVHAHLVKELQPLEDLTDQRFRDRLVFGAELQLLEEVLRIADRQGRDLANRLAAKQDAVRLGPQSRTVAGAADDLAAERRELIQPRLAGRGRQFLFEQRQQPDEVVRVPFCACRRATVSKSPGSTGQGRLPVEFPGRHEGRQFRFQLSSVGPREVAPGEHRTVGQRLVGVGDHQLGIELDAQPHPFAFRADAVRAVETEGAWFEF